jgi:hypothetical protein
VKTGTPLHTATVTASQQGLQERICNFTEILGGVKSGYVLPGSLNSHHWLVPMQRMTSLPGVLD